jgi:hypothetical protein
MGKKQEVITKIFQICQQKDNFEFDNDLVEEICRQIGFKNKFDVTKLDNIKLLPQELLTNDYAIIHLGSGRHGFIKGINKLYHQFEPIQESID